jgi:vacuolar protein sorting-associated protein 1
MDRGTDARELLIGKGEVQLKLGFVGIKNRSQEDINLKRTVVESIAGEKMFFSKSPIYSSLPPSCLGTTALISSLTKVLESNIIQFLPELMAQIKERKGKLHQMYLMVHAASRIMASPSPRTIRSSRHSSGTSATSS